MYIDTLEILGIIYVGICIYFLSRFDSDYFAERKLGYVGIAMIVIPIIVGLARNYF
jgi:hypothetical protein